MNRKNKLREATMLLLICLCFSTQPVYAQIRWDGGGGDNQWNNAANWTADTLPGPNDDVILDNNIVSGNYTVILPAGAQVVTVKTLAINPSVGNIIEVILPTANIAAPALVFSGPGYGLTINQGGIFQNASGISSGQSLQIADSIRVNNGGHYIHKTRASHAASIAQILSRSPGTETGIVEFDVPGTTGYTISASGRVYGTLILSAHAAGMNRTYSSSGSNDLIVRGDLKINAGVSYNVNLGGDIIVDNNLTHTGNVFNISAGGDTTFLKLKGGLLQSGVITETSTAEACIELCGNSVQQVNVTGSITNSVGLRMNNAAEAVLQSPLVLPWKLELVNGRITTSAINLLRLLPGSIIVADSLINSSFINGPLRKEGLSAADHFLFPVGKGINMRWLALKNATGNFTVEFFKGDPRSIDTTCGPGIDHISRIEYWTVEADTGQPVMANPELSFTDPNSGGVTDLSMLRVAQLVNDIWSDAGNTMVTGTAGANGSVTGNALTTYGSATKFFTLASAGAMVNPLPVVLTWFGASAANGSRLKWICAGEGIRYFDLLHSRDNRHFKALSRVYANKYRKQYEYTDKQTGLNYYKLRITSASGLEQESEIIRVVGFPEKEWVLIINSSQLVLSIKNAKQGRISCTIVDASGNSTGQFYTNLLPGANSVSTDISKLVAGLYFLRVLGDDGTARSISFIK